MNRGLKHVVVVLLALLVMGASSKAAVCDLVCALAAHPAGCAADADAATPHAMEMPGMHCAGKMSASPVCDAHVRDGDPRVCRHAPVYAIADSSPQRGATVAVAWWVVETLPVRLELRHGRRLIDPDDPAASPRVDRFPLSLRV